MNTVLLMPLGLQMVLVFFDESFHLRRGLKTWESWGHPIDVLSVLVCLLLVNFVPYSPRALNTYAILGALSCICITKDEFVHASLCTPWEHWIHAVLFVLHPTVFVVVGLAWPLVHRQPGLLDQFTVLPEFWFWFLKVYLVITALVLFYQVIYWNFWRKSVAVMG